ncbi:MAG: type II secretion system F family protein [Thermomicrobiales bacterium]
MSSSPIVFAATAFVAVLAGVFAIMAGAGRRSATTRRLAEHAMPVTVNEAKRLERVNVLKEHQLSAISALNAVLGRFKPARTAVGELTRANAWLTVSQYLFVRCLLAAVAYFAVNAITGTPFLGVAAVPVGLMLPRIALLVLANRRRKAFEGQLAEAIDLLVGALRAGYGFLQAIEAATKELPDPMCQELTRIIDQVNIGTPPVSALLELTERISSYDLTLFVTAVSVQRSVGGNLAEVLENIAATIRERRRIKAEVRAITTGPRVSSYILGLFPLGLMLYFTATDDAYRSLMLHETIGKIMLGFAAVWSLVGLFLSTAVAKVEY